MRLRLILQPAWVRFVVWALFLAVWWGLFTSLQSSYEFESAVLSGIVFGAALGGYFTATTQGMHRAAHEAVTGLDQSGRADAINAVLRGVAPANPDVRASATRSAESIFATSRLINSSARRSGPGSRLGSSSPRSSPAR